jgi:hypothetical protein
MLNEDLKYREKLWNESDKQIFLNKSESDSFYEIMVQYLHQELEHYHEYVEDNGIPNNHMLYELLNVVNGLSPSHKKEILEGFEIKDIDYKIGLENT